MNSRFIRLITVLVLLVNVMSQTAIGGNRFLNLYVIRCHDDHGPRIPKVDCEDDNLSRLKMKQISQEEFDFLKKEDAVGVYGPTNQPKSYCKCGCFAPWTRLSVVSDGTESLMPISEVMSQYKVVDLVSLAPDSTLSKINKKTHAIKSTISGPETKPLVVISTKGGAELSLTTGHPVLLSTGQVIAAKNLQAGHSLVDENGSADEVVAISEKKMSEHAMNVMTAGGENFLSHFIFAEKRLVGDLHIQNSLKKETDAVVMRR